MPGLSEIVVSPDTVASAKRALDEATAGVGSFAIVGSAEPPLAVFVEQLVGALKGAGFVRAADRSEANIVSFL